MQVHVTFLFASSLDATLFPNGTSSAAPGCLERTQQLLEQLKAASYPVAYVTDHYLSLAKEGQRTFKLPDPDYWICNLGTEIYDAQGKPDKGFQQIMGPPFNKEKLSTALKGNPNLTLQKEDEIHGPHKLSFHYSAPVDDTLRDWVAARVEPVAQGARLIRNVEDSNRASLHLVPSIAGNARALNYLTSKLGLPKTRVFFAGCAEDDLEPLISGVCGTLVKNATESVRARAKELAENTEGARLILSRDYYGDGVIEGLRAYDFVR
uniref:Hydroxymethylpyrimidine pyrophosphatase n=1 Tax=Candidatus Kentrum sp. MB TaxID=2138164 RepID=A0A450X4H4_9GAMM|nr:MAG: Hydroxymethylpyrimidine pyrophosphatase [Candidatus Kentron sp. MB]VFK30574.1 MAG: Hydroxymethylpyrimidine pyrophosphatase [Candidatus Kentron sp. MB]VFK75307.1 MAG: Hydroxymethylpyrimidine pyrophosphatase [Candidatus Kentron sp. MB]